MLFISISYKIYMYFTKATFSKYHFLSLRLLTVELYNNFGVICRETETNSHLFTYIFLIFVNFPFKFLLLINFSLKVLKFFRDS